MDFGIRVGLDLGSCFEVLLKTSLFPMAAGMSTCLEQGYQLYDQHPFEFPNYTGYCCCSKLVASLHSKAHLDKITEVAFHFVLDKIVTVDAQLLKLRLLLQSALQATSS